jgi:hypothetical protein
MCPLQDWQARDATRSIRLPKWSTIATLPLRAKPLEKRQAIIGF